jgi:hypothetical protein
MMTDDKRSTVVILEDTVVSVLRHRSFVANYFGVFAVYLLGNQVSVAWITFYCNRRLRLTTWHVIRPAFTGIHQVVPIVTGSTRFVVRRRAFYMSLRLADSHKKGEGK